MVILRFDDPHDWLAKHADIRIARNNLVADDFIWYDTHEREGEIWFFDPRHNKKFKKKVYAQEHIHALRVDFKIKQSELDKFTKLYGIEERNIDIGQNFIRVLTEKEQ